MQPITITALFRDEATEGIHRLESSLTRVGSRLSALNTEMVGRGQSALTSFKSGLSNVGDVLDGVGKKLDRVIEKMGDRLVAAAKKAVIGVVGLGTAFTVMAMNVEKEVQNAQITLSNFLGGGPGASPAMQAKYGMNSDYVKNMIAQMQGTSYIASVQAQTTGMQQLLVNPNYRGTAPNVNAAMLSIASMSPGGSENVYNQLINSVGRMEAYGRVNTRMSMLLQRGGISQEGLAQQLGFVLGPNTSPKAAQAMAQTVAQTMTVGQYLNYIQQQAQQRTGFDPAHPYAQTPTEKLMATQSISGAVSYGKAQIGATLHQSLEGTDFTKDIVALVAPIQTLVGSLGTTVIPPFVKMLTSVVNVLNGLLPVVTPLLSAFSTGLAAMVGKLQPYIPMLASVGKQFAAAFQRALTAALPLIPAFFAGLIAILQLLPPFLTVATPAILVLSKLLQTIAEVAAKLTSLGPVAYGLAGVAAALLGIAAVAKAVEVLKGVATWLESIKKAEGFWATLKTGLGMGGGPKATQEVGKSTVAEMTVAVMKVGEMLGGGGGGGPLGGGGGKGPLGKAERTAERDIEKTVEGDAAAAGEGALATSTMRRLFPTAFKGIDFLKGKGLSALGRLAAGKDALLSKGGTLVNSAKGLLGMGEEGGGLLGMAGTGVGEASAGALAGTAGLAAGAGAGAYLGTTYLLNHFVGGNTVRHWFGMGDEAKPSTHLAKPAQDFIKEFLGDNKDLISQARKHGDAWAKTKDPYAILHYYNSLSPAQQAAAGWQNPDRPTAATTAAANTAAAIHFNAPVTVVANDPVAFEKALVAKAREAQRRGARQPTVGPNQGRAPWINQGRPV